MGKIVPKLDLNKNPQSVDNNSIVYAKNIRLGRDGNLYPDFPFEKLGNILYNALYKENIIYEIIGGREHDFDDIFDDPELDSNAAVNDNGSVEAGGSINDDSIEQLTPNNNNLVSNGGSSIQSSDVASTVVSHNIYYINHIVGLDNKIYFLLNLVGNRDLDENNKYAIVEYNEITNIAKTIACAWTYSGGEIDGCVTKNHTGETILTICEKCSGDIKVPIKHINLSKCSYDDDESLYTQAPNIPLTNLFLVDTYPKTIPNGVYQFFIRYEIRKNFYTNWFPCSKECFAGNSTKQDTVQGSVKYVNTHRDSDTSFVFTVEHINEECVSFYKRFQIGFILSHDDEIVARSWKHFNIASTDNIYFDYDKSSIQEIDITDLLYDTYELYNVGNIDYYKNKLYIANYRESDKNPITSSAGNLAELAKRIQVDLVQKELDAEAVYIDGKGLSGEVGNNVYTSWGSNKINSLFATEKYNNVSYLIDNRSTKEKKQIYHMWGEWNSNINPDIYLLINAELRYGDREISTNDTNLRLPTFRYDYNWARSRQVLSFTYIGSWTNGNVNNLHTHVLESYPELSNGKWFIRRDSDYNFYFGDGYALDEGCDPPATILLQLEDNILSLVKNNAPTTTLRYIKLKGADNTSINVYTTSDGESDYYYKGNTIKEKDITSFVLNKVNSYIQGVEIDDNDAYYVISVNNVYKRLVSIEVGLADYTYDYETERVIIGDEEGAGYHYNVFATKTNYTRNYNVSIDTAYIDSSSQKNVQYNTLMPFTDYKFYAHYVDKKGIITNGYEIGTFSLDNFNHAYTKSLIYPIFNNIHIPDEFCSCFISIAKPTETVCEGFGFTFESAPGATTGNLKINCLEADALLYPLSNNVKVITVNGSEITNNKLGKYYPSGVVGDNTFDAFGNGGYIGLSGVPITAFNRPGYEVTKLENNGFYYYPYDIEPCYFSLKLVVRDTNNNTATLKYTIEDNVVTENSFANYANKGITLSTQFIRQNAQYGRGFIAITIGEKAYINNSESYIKDFSSSIIVQTSTTSFGAYIYYNGFYSLYGSGRSLDIARQAESAGMNRVGYTERNAGSVNPNQDIPHLFWIKISNNNNETDNALIKLTPYISEKNLVNNKYDNYETLNSPSYICNVYKPKIEQSKYVSGTDIYDKQFDGNNLTITEDLNVALIDSSNKYTIYSNFNLNYLSMSEDFVPNIRRYAQNADGTNPAKQIISALNSLTLSDCYKLESMYKEYIRKYFFVVDDSTITEFNNTIRSSKVIADEVFNNIYEFLAEDYYNVPTNRGNITNLIAVVNNIYVHTEHALYRFAGNNSLVGNESDVVTKETDIFNSGISEIFDSEVGYAGLVDKKESIVTFNSYFFYDRRANAVYAYEGQNNIIDISLSISKLIRFIMVESNNNMNVRFASDYKADRIFVNFSYTTSANVLRNVCLSYDLKTKSFVSIHDFNFNESITTRNNTYFILNKESTSEDVSVNNIDNIAIAKINHNGYLNALNNYNDFYKLSRLNTYDEQINRYSCCIDIICNMQFETIKCVNYINWVCSCVKDISSSNRYGQYSHIDLITLAEEYIDKYPGNKLRIYSDQCYTSLIDLTEIQNDESYYENKNTREGVNPDSFTKVRFNKGVWSYNYIRDIKNSRGNFTSDNMSVIYGKYFVVRLIMSDKNFKLENVKINMNNYE